MKNRSGLLDAAAIAAGSAAVANAATASATNAGITETPFRFSRFGANWIYQLSGPLDSPAARAKKLVSVSIGLVTGGAAAYYPSKYDALLKLCMATYLSTPDPAFSPLSILPIYLSLLTTNKYAGKCGSFDDSSFDPRRALLAPLKFLVSQFKADPLMSVTIWQAMLLRKRVFVYHPSMSEVMNLVKIFPLLGAWHRQDVSMLRPLVNLDSNLEMSELQAAGVYVAGFTDPAAASRKDLYDLYVDAHKKTYSFGGNPGAGVAAAAQAASPSSGSGASGTGGDRPSVFGLTKFHRTTADSFAKAAETENDQGVIKVVAQATKDLIDKIATLRAEEPSGVITEEGLAASGLPAQMAIWIHAVAVAEGMTKK